VTPAQYAAAALAFLLPLAVLALGWWGERRAHRRTRAALDRERATVEAARVLYGEARMREAARMVRVRDAGAAGQREREER
jgi:hypothetical protein